MADKFKIAGLRELQDALKGLPNSTRKPLVRRVLTKASLPIRDAAQAKAPKLTGALAVSIVTGTKLNKRQKRLNKRLGKSEVEVYTGTANPAGVPEEFGWIYGPPQSFMRPAWDGNKDQALETIKTEMALEIEKTAKRVAGKAAKLAAKG